MGTRMTVKRTIRPKSGIIKNKVVRSTTYHIKSDGEGNFTMTKTKVRKVVKNV